jgi:Zn-dependent protease
MRYTLFAGSYFGIPVRIHFTFPLILIVFGVEAWMRGGWPEVMRAMLVTLSVFVCVVLHEFGHSLQVRRYGIRVRDVVLLPIGGMARADRIPEVPRQEIIVAISGPLVNFVLAAGIFGLMTLLDKPIVSEPDYLTSLFAINLVLGTFNLIPAYPMDGGRILRGLLAFKLPYLRATRYATVVGQLIALGFVVLGFRYHELMMLPIIAVFVFVGAMTEENAIRARYLLGDKRIREFVDPHPPSDPNLAPGEGTSVPVIDADTPALQVYYTLLAQRQPAAIVVDGNGIIGTVNIDRLKRFDTPPTTPR